MEVITMRELREDLRNQLDRGVPLVVTRHNRPAVVVVPIEFLREHLDEAVRDAVLERIAGIVGEES